MCNLKEPESEIFFPKKKNGKLEHNATTFEMLNQMDCSKQNKTKKKRIGGGGGGSVLYHLLHQRQFEKIENLDFF
mgnify:CR=1 FL=1